MGQEQYTYTYHPLNTTYPIDDFADRVMAAKTKQDRIEAAYEMLTQHGVFTDRPEIRQKFLYG